MTKGYPPFIRPLRIDIFKRTRPGSSGDTAVRHIPERPAEVSLETLGQIHNEIRAKILNVSQGALHVEVSEFVPAKPVRVWFSADCCRDGQVIFCRAENTVYQAGIHFPPDASHQKRSELRIPLADRPAVLTRLDDGKETNLLAKAIDISRSGLGLFVDRQLTPKTWVKVELSFAIAFGEVVYSKPDSSGAFRVGLRVETLIMREGPQAKEFDLSQPPSLRDLV